MSTNTLEQILGGIVKPSDVNQIINALITEFVGRNSSGVPESGKSLGTTLAPWGPAYLTSIILNGLPVDESLVTGIANQIKSGQERSTSTLADYIRANGAANSVAIQGGTTSLITSINGSEVITAADLEITGLTVAPGSNNTCLVDDASLIDQESSKFIGEDRTFLTIGTVGSEISDRTGMIIALKGATEIMYGVLKDATTFHQAYRGFFLDSSGDPIEREVLSDGDTLTLMELGWVFLQNNGSTLDVSYLTPIISFDEPTLDLHGDALADSQYWFDITNQEWKRHNGAAFVSINRILIGSCVIDAANCIGSRSIDFNKEFDDLIINELEVVSNTVVGALQNRTSISVNGQSIQVQYSPLNWIMPGDLETGESESSSQEYYIYLSDKGEKFLSTIKYYDRPDLKGLYHPYNSWRCIGVVTNDGSSNFSDVLDYHTRMKLETFIIYRLTTNVANDDDPLGSSGGEWEIADDTKLETQVGNRGVAELNGTFSYGSTGYWSIRYHGYHGNASAVDPNITLDLKVTDDNSVYTAVTRSRDSIATIGDGGSTQGEALLKVENITNDKVRLDFTTTSASTVCTGSGSSSFTYIIFEKLGDL